MLEVDLPLLHQVLVHLLAVLPSPLQPGGHGPLVQQEGVHDRLDRAAPTDQIQHHQHQPRRALQAEERGARGRGKGATTDGAQVAPLLPTMHPDRAAPRLATCRAVQVGAECLLRVHRWQQRTPRFVRRLLLIAFALVLSTEQEFDEAAAHIGALGIDRAHRRDRLRRGLFGIDRGRFGELTGFDCRGLMKPRA